MNIIVRSITVDDYEQVRNVDVLTQKQYLGVKFNQMNEEEKNSHLVSRKPEFQINVDTGNCFTRNLLKRLNKQVLKKLSDWQMLITLAPSNSLKKLDLN